MILMEKKNDICYVSQYFYQMRRPNINQKQ